MSPDIAEYLIESPPPAGDPTTEFLELIRFASVHIAQVENPDS